MQPVAHAVGAIDCRTRIAAARGASSGDGPGEAAGDPGADRDHETDDDDQAEGHGIERREGERDDRRQPGELGDGAQPMEPRVPGDEAERAGSRQGRGHRARVRGGDAGRAIAHRHGDLVDGQGRPRPCRAVEPEREPRHLRRPEPGLAHHGPVGEHGARRVVGDRAAGVEDDEPVGDVGEQPDVVGDAHDGRPRIAELPDQAADDVGGAMVLRRRRLVEDEHRRPHRQHRRDRHQLPPRPAEVIRVAIEHVLEAQAPRRVGDAVLHLGGAAGPGCADRTPARRRRSTRTAGGSGSARRSRRAPRAGGPASARCPGRRS